MVLIQNALLPAKVALQQQHHDKKLETCSFIWPCHVVFQHVEHSVGAICFIYIYIYMLLIFKSYEIKVFYLSITGRYGVHT